MNPIQEITRKTQSILRTENANIYYGEFLALKGINLDVLSNKVTAFIGPSGCGKSTLAALLQSPQRFNS